MDVMPTDDGFTEALIKRLLLWASEKAVLVLFTARRQMQAVRMPWPGIIRILLPPRTICPRGSTPQTLPARGRRHPSVLFGVASFAEGIDLPGRYLDHVIITRLPFSVPDDPIEASLAEWVTGQGGNPFMEITVPDASIKLVQAVGRLLRTESDTGRVTILDRRIVARRYGQLLLDALPPFRRIINAIGLLP